MPINRIVYSMRIMKELVARGHVPIATMPNPRRQDFICWVFENTPEFQKDMDELAGGASHG